MTERSALAELIEEHTEAAPGIERSPSEPGVSYGVRGRAFAVVAGDVLEVDLGPAVAAAAIRTPDTAPSARGPDWVRFAPPVLDRFARDRAVAWFEAAQRRAAGRPIAS
ncbi:MAG TPA: hypothetical protein VGK63_04640 [Candidatus Limnocylindrales bacterium]